MRGEKFIPMRYSDFSTEQIASPMYQEVAQKLLSLAKDEDSKAKMTRNIV